MCTLILLHRHVPGWPIVVGSNRDEYLARPSAPPALFPSEGEAFMAPQDLQEGGTWMGINARGLFVGITNRRAQAPPPADARSRGQLVRRLLALPDVDAVAAALAGSEPRYRPFHVVASDGQRALLAVLSAEAPRVEVKTLEPGLHVICNAPDSMKASELRASLQEVDWTPGLPSARAALRAVLRSHARGSGALEDACVHLPEYGTRSSAIVGIGPRRWHWWHADGAPCQSKYQNYSRLLDSIQSQAPLS